MIAIPGFRIEKELASGSSGTVYKALQIDPERVVAIKVVTCELFDDEETKARFLREAKIHGQLSHTNILKIFDFGFAEDRPYLVTEYVEGGSLRDLLRTHGTLDLSLAFRLGSEIAGGLSQAHRQEIVHRDLKPENVLLTESQQVKVADFGLAKTNTGGDTVQTVNGIIFGTPGYLAPEVILGQPAGPPSDVYALGVILFEMISGRFPFESRSPVDLVRAQVVGDLIPLAECCPELDLEVEAFVHRCLALEPRARPESGSEMIEELRRLRSKARPRRVTAARSTLPVRKLDSRSLLARATQKVSSRGVSLGAFRWVRHPKVTVPMVLGFFLTALVVVKSLISPPGAGVPVPRATSVSARTVSLAPRTRGASLPEIVAISVGANQARLHLSQPLTKPWEYVLRPQGSGADISGVLPAGEREPLIEKLNSSTEYEEYVGKDYAGPTMKFRTLEKLNENDAIILDTSTAIDDLALASSGVHVTCVLHDSGLQSISVWESTDAGLTWEKRTSFETPGAAVFFVSAAVVSSGVVVTWGEIRSGAIETVIAFEARGSSKWTVSRQTEVSCAGLDLLPGRSEDQLVALNLHSDPARFLLFSPSGLNTKDASSSEPPVTSGNTSPPTGSGDFLGTDSIKQLAFSPPCKIDRHVLVRVGNRFGVAMRGRPANPRSTELWWSVQDAEERPAWLPPRRLATGGDGVETCVEEPCAGSFGDIVVVAYGLAENVVGHLSMDGGRSFDPPTILATGVSDRVRSMAARGDELYLAHVIGDRELKTRWLSIKKSVDGRRWEQHTRFRLPSSGNRSVRKLRLVAARQTLVVVLAGNANGASVFTVPW